MFLECQQNADALANLAATAEEIITILVCDQWVASPLVDGGVQEVKTVSVYEIEEEDWLQLVIDYLGHRKLRSESRRKT